MHEYYVYNSTVLYIPSDSHIVHIMKEKNKQTKDKRYTHINIALSDTVPVTWRQE